MAGREHILKEHRQPLSLNNFMSEPLISNTFILEKYPGKGGWIYARLPKTFETSDAPFGWTRVKGTIDKIEVKSYHLMPMSSEYFFLPVKSEIRKKIKKTVGDYVRVILYLDESPLEMPEDLRVCLKDEPEALETFSSYSESEQKAFIDWINAAKRDETRVSRIKQTIDKILKKERLSTVSTK